MKKELVITTKKFDFGEIYAHLNEANQIEKIVNEDIELEISIEDTTLVSSRDFSIYQTVYLIKTDPKLNALKFVVPQELVRVI